jgi:hypothetical protein
MAELVEYLLSKHESLNSNPSIAKTKQNKKTFRANKFSKPMHQKQIFDFTARSRPTVFAIK